jgi:S-methylmethionine-dependent homocysteine/selenocysteine methylase
MTDIPGMSPSDSLRGRLSEQGPALLLDGAMGTELLRRGVPTPLPLWSAPANVEHPEVIARIHADYVAAGCELITTNTFRTTHYAMERAGKLAEWERWNRQSVALARRAAGNRAFVLGSLTTLEDCYRPDLVPKPHVLRHYHARQVALLSSLSIDGFLLETFNTLRELDVAYDEARRYDLPVLASVVLKNGERLYDGTALYQVAEWAMQARPDVLLVNCAAPEVVDAALRYLGDHVDVPLGAYANVGRQGGEMGFVFTHACSTQRYALWAARWEDLGVRVIGGCCGTTPEYMRAIRGLLQ